MSEHSGKVIYLRFASTEDAERVRRAAIQSGESINSWCRGLLLECASIVAPEQQPEQDTEEPPQ